MEDSGSRWEEATIYDIASPPRFIVTWEEVKDDTTFSKFALRYTTADPTTNQNTPQNSIGGHIAPNDVYVEGKINEFINPTQTSITLSSDTTVPESSGMVQIGPEISTYASVDLSNHRLLGVARHLIPTVSFPSSIIPLREKSTFLEVDRLFNTKPSNTMEQYRCVAFVVENVSVHDIHVYLTQSSNADVNIDIGIEVPEYDIREDTLALAMVASSVVSLTGTAMQYPLGGALLSVGSDLYAGGYITIDYNGTPVLAEISSCSVNALQTTLTLVIDQSITRPFGTKVRIMPAPAQRLSNDVSAPTENSGRFLGFFGDGGPNDPNYTSMRDGGVTYRAYDAFYVWIKRTMTSNVRQSDNTGAIIHIRYEE